MAQAFSFHGVGFSLRGDKDRFVLPATFRKLVKDASHGSRILCVAKHERWPCLTGFGTSRLEDLPAQVEKEEASHLARGLPFDESGRFVMPGHLAQLGGLGDEVYFNGNGPFFTIWTPDALMTMGTGWEPMQAACKALAEEARATKAKRS